MDSSGILKFKLSDESDIKTNIPINLQLLDSKYPDGSEYFKEIAPTGGVYQQMFIPWTEFIQGAWVQPERERELNMDSIRGIQFSVNAENVEGAFSVDHIELKGREDIVVDKAELIAKRDEVQAIITGATVGLSPGAYTPGAVNNLQAALDDVNSLIANPNVFQYQANEAIVTLTQALDAFTLSEIYTSTILADCENGLLTKLGTKWNQYATDPSYVNQVELVTGNFYMTEGGADGTNFAALLSGELVNPGPDLYESAGIQFYVNEDHSIDYDFSGAVGFSFYHKGDELNFNVKLSLYEEAKGYDHTYVVPAHTEWTMVEVSLEELVQEDWIPESVKYDMDPSKIIGFEWGVKNGNPRTFSFGIDQVTVHEMAVSGTEQKEKELKNTWL